MSSTLSEETESASQGVFVRIPVSDEAKKRAQRDFQAAIEAGAMPVDGLRATAHDACLRSVETTAAELASTANETVFDALVGFLRDENAATLRRPVALMPCAILVAGVNVPDHSVLFGRLREHARARVGPATALLRSRDASSLKGLVARLAEELLGDDVSVPASRLTLESLGHWYQQRVEHAAQDRITVILEDFEAFPGNIMNDFLHACHHNRHSLPISICLGVATAPDTVHRTLADPTARLLKTRSFRVQDSSARLSDLIHSVVFGPSQPSDFILSAGAYNLLVDSFLFRNFSVHSFLHGLRLALFDHFTSNKLSGVRYSVLRTESLSSELASLVLRLPSFRRHIESLSHNPKLQCDILTDNESLIGELGRLYRQNDHKQSLYLIALRSFAVLVKETKFGGSLGQRLREFHSLILTQPISQTKGFNDLFVACESFLDAKTMLRTVRLILTELAEEETLKTSGEEQEFAAERTDLSAKADEMEKLRENHSGETEEGEEGGRKEGRGKKRMRESDGWSKAQRMREWKQLGAGLNPRNKSRFVVLRNEILSVLRSLFSRMLVPPQMRLNLPETVLYPSQDAPAHTQHWLSSSLDGAPRLSSFSALSRPHSYLSTLTKTPRSSLSSLLPDTSIAFKLHLECGKMINLFDWMQSFSEVVASEDARDDSLVQARFIRAVSELQLLGFIKPTTRKTDHVIRTTM